MSFSWSNNTRTGPCIDLRSVVAIEWRDMFHEKRDQPQRCSTEENRGYTIADKRYPFGSRRIYSIKPTNSLAASHNSPPGEPHPKESDDEVSLLNDYICKNPRGYRDFRLIGAHEISNERLTSSNQMKLFVPCNSTDHVQVLTSREKPPSNKIKTWQADIQDLDQDFQSTYRSTHNQITRRFGVEWQGRSEVGMFNLGSVNKDFPTTTTRMRVSCDTHLLIPESDETADPVDPVLFNLRLPSELYDDQTLRYRNGKTRRLFDASEEEKESDLSLPTQSSIAIVEWSKALN